MKLENKFNYILLFIYVFAFPITLNQYQINSSYLVYIYMMIVFFLNKQIRNLTIQLLKSKSVKKVIFFQILIILLSVMFPLMHSTYDYSLLRTLLNQLFSIIVGIILFSKISIQSKKEHDIKIDLLSLFIIQSVIIILSASNRIINDFFNNFRTETAIVRGQLGYGGIRGLSISGSSFFGLAIVYALIFILMYEEFTESFENNSLKKVFYLTLLILGGTSSGRTSLVGLIVAIVFYQFKNIRRNGFKIPNKIKIKTIFWVFTIISLILLYHLIKTIDFSLLIHNLTKLKDFLLQFYYNYKREGKIYTTSTDGLKKMYFKISFKTFLLGDGHYQGTNSSYYMGTDAGYMRNILFFGVIGLCLLIFQTTNYLDFKKKRKRSFSILVLTFILHVKGEVFGYSIMYHKILLFLLLEQLYKTKMGEKNETRKIS